MMTSIVQKIFLLILPFVLGIAAMNFSHARQQKLIPFADLFRDESALFLRSIRDTKSQKPARIAISGVTIPHHLLAADIIARTFWTISEQQYDKIIVLTPDHFRRSKALFATTLRDFDTVFGPVKVKRRDIERL